MNKIICDCCQDEITDPLSQGYLRIPVAFYQFLIGNNPNMHKRQEKPQQQNGWMSMFDSRPETVDYDLCGNCLKRFVELREMMLDSIQKGMLR